MRGEGGGESGVFFFAKVYDTQFINNSQYDLPVFLWNYVFNIYVAFVLYCM